MMTFVWKHFHWGVLAPSRTFFWKIGRERVVSRSTEFGDEAVQLPSRLSLFPYTAAEKHVQNATPKQRNM